jgi:putative glycosyltransferase (TIGR04372 family)
MSLLSLALALLPLLFIRAIRPLILIRFGGLTSQRIGHFAGNTEVYLAERDLQRGNRRILDIFYHNNQISSQQLQRMWDRELHVNQFANRLASLNGKLPGGQIHKVPWRRNQDRDVDGLLMNIPPRLSFTAEEERQGAEALVRLGIPKGRHFVCFHARDSAYLNASFPPNDWSYSDIRNSNIQNYLGAANELARRGNFTVRMGAVVEQSLQTSDPMILDYATSFRTDFLDIFLSAKCRFFICSATGIERLPMIFRRPIAFVNWMPLDLVNTWGHEDLFIPKNLWLREQDRSLTFKEIISSGIGRYLLADQYREKGIEAVENTPEEITALAVEMDERLNGTWETTEEDEELQKRFWSLYEANELHRVFRIKIGADFLRQNRHLLD